MRVELLGKFGVFVMQDHGQLTSVVLCSALGKKSSGSQQSKACVILDCRQSPRHFLKARRERSAATLPDSA